MAPVSSASPMLPASTSDASLPRKPRAKKGNKKRGKKKQHKAPVTSAVTARKATRRAAVATNPIPVTAATPSSASTYAAASRVVLPCGIVFSPACCSKSQGLSANDGKQTRHQPQPLHQAPPCPAPEAGVVGDPLRKPPLLDAPSDAVATVDPAEWVQRSLDLLAGDAEFDSDDERDDIASVYTDIPSATSDALRVPGCDDRGTGPAIRGSLVAMREALHALLSAIDTRTLLAGFGHLLMELLDKDAARSHTQTIFDASNPLTKPLDLFLDEYVTPGICSREAIPLAFLLLTRLRSGWDIPVTFRNVHRLLAVTIMLAAKLLDDRFCYNYYYAHPAQVHMTKLNALEVHACFMLGFTFELPLSEYLTAVRAATEAAQNSVDMYAHMWHTQTLCVPQLATAQVSSAHHTAYDPYQLQPYPQQYPQQQQQQQQQQPSWTDMQAQQLYAMQQQQQQQQQAFHAQPVPAVTDMAPHAYPQSHCDAYRDPSQQSMQHMTAPPLAAAPSAPSAPPPLMRQRPHAGYPQAQPVLPNSSFAMMSGQPPPQRAWPPQMQQPLPHQVYQMSHLQPLPGSVSHSQMQSRGHSTAASSRSPTPQPKTRPTTFTGPWGDAIVLQDNGGGHNGESRAEGQFPLPQDRTRQHLSSLQQIGHSQWKHPSAQHQVPASSPSPVSYTLHPEQPRKKIQMRPSSPSFFEQEACSPESGPAYGAQSFGLPRHALQPGPTAGMVMSAAPSCRQAAGGGIRGAASCQPIKHHQLFQAYAHQRPVCSS